MDIYHDLFDRYYYSYFEFVNEQNNKNRYYIKLWIV